MINGEYNNNTDIFIEQIIPKKLKLLDIKRDNKLVQLIIIKKFVHEF